MKKSLLILLLVVSIVFGSIYDLVDEVEISSKKTSYYTNQFTYHLKLASLYIDEYSSRDDLLKAKKFLDDADKDLELMYKYGKKFIRLSKKTIDELLKD